jgi:hypothetical protein
MVMVLLDAGSVILVVFLASMLLALGLLLYRSR